MTKHTKHDTTNYKALKPFFEAVDKAGGHAHFTAPGYMDLVIEKLWYSDIYVNPVYSVAHYGEQNGDLMRDPDMELSVDDSEKRIMPLTWRNDYVGRFDQVFIKRNGKNLFSQRLLTDLDHFLWMWGKNIIEQGFRPDQIG